MERTTHPPWEKRLREAARSDSYALFHGHMQRLGLPEKPKLMLDGTIRVIQAISAYASMDGIALDPFLDMQRYNPCEAPGARYVLTFDPHGKCFARVLADSKMVQPDLADLRFDYSESELTFWFDYGPDASDLCVRLQDVIWTKPFNS